MVNGRVRMSKKKLIDFEGAYVDDGGTTRTITLKDGILFSQREGRASFPIFPETSGQFYFAFNPDLKYKFHTDKKGMVVGATFIRDGEETKLRKMKNGKYL